MMTELLNLDEASKDSKLSIHWWRKAVSQRRVPFVKIGRRVLVRREDLETLISKGFQAPRESEAR
jgi:excisionase family DNA binding protein